MRTSRAQWGERRARAATAMQALAIVVAYFGVVVALTFLVVDAAGYPI